MPVSLERLLERLAQAIRNRRILCIHAIVEAIAALTRTCQET